MRVFTFFIGVCFCGLTPISHASWRPFKEPAGTQVTQERTKDYTLWRINAPDSNAFSAVAKIKLPRQYQNSKSFQRFVNNFYKKDRTFSALGVKLKTSWKNGAYVVSGTGGGWRVYGKGRLDKKGEWLYNWVVGRPASRYTAALEKMVKSLK